MLYELLLLVCVCVYSMYVIDNDGHNQHGEEALIFFSSEEPEILFVFNTLHLLVGKDSREPLRVARLCHLFYRF